MKLRPFLGLTALAVLASTLAPRAFAVGTRTFELDTLDELSGGDLKGTTVDSLGRVRAGWNLGSLGLSEASAVWSALVTPDGNVLLGTGNGGKVLRVSGGQASVLADTGQLVVTSLVTGWNKQIFAATIPNGRIFKIEGNKATKFVELAGADHVWALAFDAKHGALFAATGPSGKLFRIDASGQAQVYFDSEQPHLVSLALADDGTLYAGSSGQAILYKITGPGRATVLFDLPGEEAKAIALGPKGTVYAVSNEYGDLPEIPKRSGTPGQNAAGPVSAPRPKPGKGTLYRFDEAGRPEKLLHRDDTHFTAVAVGDDGRPYVGTGVEGRVYVVDEAHASSLVADTDERQVGALLLTGPKKLVLTSDPPALHEVRAVGGPDAIWTSKVLDAGLRAHFGHIAWRATGSLDVSTRSGNTEKPDSTWSDWSAALAGPGDVKSPPARFVQVRARFARDPNAVLSEMTIPFVTDNARAVVTSVDAQPRNVPPAAKENQHTPPSGGEPAAHSTQIKLTWKVDNPDADALRYRLSYRLDSETIYRDLTRPDENLTKAEYEWETATLPEGAYRVRVDASDENVNPPDRSYHHTLESPLIFVDNTPPSITRIGVSGRHVQAVVTDGVGPVARVDVAIDGRTEWRPFLPKDGIFDESTEELDLDVATLVGPGNHLVTVRAFDHAGNYTVRAVELK